MRPGCEVGAGQGWETLLDLLVSHTYVHVQHVL